MITKGLIIVAIVLAAIVILLLIYRFMPRRISQSKFEAQWKKIQGYCKTKENWPRALEEADKLLNKALKKKRLKGKSMGEKMVSAQRLFTDNDDLWYAHNLYKKVIAGTKRS